MDMGFMEAVEAYWDKRADTLAPLSRQLDLEMEAVFRKLTDTFSDEQTELYMEAEDAMNRREASFKELFYRTGFQDAVRVFISAFESKTDMNADEPDK